MALLETVLLKISYGLLPPLYVESGGGEAREISCHNNALGTSEVRLNSVFLLDPFVAIIVCTSFKRELINA